ncbi:MAG: hypothetical protein LAP38_04595 [Acidobacteriia bacterium]|nr:hypothetical protein [Terriglobia bacterium]
MPSVSSIAILGVLFCFSGAASDQTLVVNPYLRQPLKLPAFLKGKTFYVAELAGSAERSSVITANTWTSPNPAWLPPGVNFNRELTMTDITWQREAAEIVREALVESLRSGGGLAQDEASADYSISAQLYRFGLAEATWREYYAKLEMWVSVTDHGTGAVTDIFALGTAVRKKEDRKNKAQEAIQASLETALARGITNFFYNAKLKSTVAPAPILNEGGGPGRVALEVRRFRIAQSVVLPNEFQDFLYAQLLEKLKEAGLTDTVVGENEVADSPDGEALVLEGTMMKAEGAWYRGAGEKKLTAEITLRRSPDETVMEKEITAGPNLWTRASYPDENELWSAPALADRIVKEIRGARRK